MSKPLSKLVEVGPNRYRELHGLLYEDFDIGDIYEHRPGRTITEVDNIWQSLINMNNHPLHIDSEYASSTEFGRPVVSSLVTFSIVGGLSLASTSARCIANLGWERVRLPNPLFVGDTLYAETEIIAKRVSKSRKNEGIVTVRTKGIKDGDTIVIEWERSFLVAIG